MDTLPQHTLSITDGGPGASVLHLLRFGPWDFGARAPHTAALLTALTWPPLFVLTLIGGVAFGGVQIPFLHDIAAHVRFLLAVPLLVLADLAIGARLRQTVRYFLDAGLVAGTATDGFANIIARAVRIRDSRIGELVVLLTAYLATYSALSSGPVHGSTTWYQPNADGGLTVVGYWYALVALPIFQFLVFRWLYRMFVWGWFLLQVSRLDLQLTPTHPDGAGGLGFLGKSAVAFGPVLFCLSAVTASGIATSILFAGGAFETYQNSYAALIVLALLIFTGPLLVFAPVLRALKRQGLIDYGTLATQYTQRFQAKWIQGAGADDSLLGSGDIQSLADLSTSYELVRKVRAVPIERSDFFAIAVPGIVPGLPLLATMMPLGDILKKLLRLLA